MSRDNLKEYAARIRAQRLAEQHVTGRCHLCPDWHTVGTLAETTAAHKAHRLKHHPHLRERKHKQHRIRSFVSGKTLDQNIANARLDGAHYKDDAA